MTREKGCLNYLPITFGRIEPDCQQKMIPLQLVGNIKTHIMSNRVLIFSAPSGSGKSTIVNHILGIYRDTMEFSVSATSRAPRGTERDGKEYHFVTPARFRELIADGSFVEYEEVYEDHFYGTLKSEVERIWAAGHVIIFDVDVKGGVNLKRYFGDKALSIFVKAPSVEVLRQRLVKRGTDTPGAIEERVAKAAEEMTYAPEFDYVLVNDDLKTAFAEVEKVVEDFLDDGKLNYSTFI